VADTGNDRIVRMDDMAGANFTSFGAPGAGTGQFDAPAAVTTDAAGNLYVADSRNARVVEFSDMLGTGWSVWQFPLNYLTPDGVAVDAGGRIYTSDSLQSQLIRADGIGGANEVWLNVNYALYLNGVEQPSGLFVDPDGAVYVADTGNDRIDRLFGMSYADELVLGTSGSGTGGLSHPHGAVARMPTKRVAVSAVTPRSLAFPTELVGTASPSQSTRLSNIGTAPLQVVSVTSSLADFPMTDDCPPQLAAGASCTAGVAFQPRAGGLRKGSVAFALQQAPSRSVALKGSGALVTVQPSELILFDGQGGTVTVRNPLASPTSVSKVAISSNFHQTNNCGALPPLASCTIQVSWNYNGFVVLGTLEVVDGSGTAQTVSITGE
jgi:hypothetical protein